MAFCLPFQAKVFAVEDNKRIESKDMIEREINELEDAYAQCLRDSVDAETLNLLWKKIKNLRKYIDRLGQK